MSSLNFDVLHEICGFLTTIGDVMSFSSTCSTLRTVAVERRLSMRVNTIHRPKSLHNLYNFVFVDEGQRGPYIRAIDVRVNMFHEEFSEDVVDRFLALLAAATRLRTLILILNAPGHARVLPAVAGLPSLQELGITASMDVATILLASTRSALRTFRWQVVGSPNNRSSGSPPIKVAPQLTLTLEELEVPPNFVTVLSRSHVSLPAVRSLILVEGRDASEEDCWQMDVLLTVFPNLDRTLVIDVWFDDRDCMVALRGKNREAQKVRGLKVLDRVGSVSAQLLCALGLTCPIRHLTLNAPYETFESTVVRTILEECAPTHLAIMSIALDDLAAPHWNSPFPDSAVAKLTHLVVDIVHYDVTSPVRLVYHIPGTGDEEMEGWDAILVSPACPCLGPGFAAGSRISSC